MSYFDTYFEQYGPDPVTDTLADVSTVFDLTGQVMTFQGWGFRETSREHPVESTSAPSARSAPYAPTSSSTQAWVKAKPSCGPCCSAMPPTP